MSQQAAVVSATSPARGKRPQVHGKILVVDDEQGARSALGSLLGEEGYDVRTAADGFKALGELRNWDCEVMLTDLRMPMMDGVALIKKAKELRPNLACILVTAFGTVETAVEAIRSGASEFLLKPVDFDALEAVIAAALEDRRRRRELESLRQETHVLETTQRLVGRSAPIDDVRRFVQQVAPSRASILITGESGTGKELVARMVHDLSPRAKHPFVRVHCAALAHSLLESEFFGHERGAFTGATGRRRGRFEEADGGTLFLDEIGEIDPSTQVKLLRFLQEREFERVGGNETITVDVRVVTATNRNLIDEIEAGHFREDLFFRLNVINIQMPPLRSCRHDIALVAQHMMAKYAYENGKVLNRLDPETIRLLEDYAWPGNVRELQNVIERAVVLSDGEVLKPHHLPKDFGIAKFPVADDVRIPGSTLAQLERFAIQKTFEATDGNSRATARILGISVRKVQYKLKAYRNESAN